MEMAMATINAHLLSFNRSSTYIVYLAEEEAIDLSIGREGKKVQSIRTDYRWGWRRERDASIVGNRTRGQAFRVLANPNVSSGKQGSKNDMIMVDPVEAKLLAAKQMERIKANEKLKRRRQIEAINGAWAMIGLTAGLVIEAQTGNSIPTQLQDYFDTIVNFFVR